MSEHFQPGQHPDADRLSAFIDDSLAPHERQETLTHLAQCSDCRSIIFLAQEAAVDDTPAAELIPQPAPVRKPWFSGWTLAWPAAVLACLILAAVYTHHLFPRDNDHVSTSTALNAPQPVKPSPPRSDSAPAHIQKPSGKPVGAATEEARVSSPTFGGKEKDLPTGRQIAGLNSQQQMPENATRTEVISGLAFRSRTQADAAAGPVPGNAAGKSFAAATPPDAGANVAASTTALAAPASGYILKTAPAPMISAGAAAVQPATKLSEVATINAQSITTNALSKKLAIEKQLFSLPSHLEAISTISNARLILAVDSAGTLFASKDAGKHWKSISARWTGRAVKVDFAFAMPYAMKKAPVIEEMRDKKASASPQDSIQSAPAPAKPVGNAAVAGVVTDPSGAVVPNASITVTNRQTAQSLTVRTDGGGHYAIQSLEPGVYAITAQSPGFTTATFNQIEVAADYPAAKNITLQIGSASETVSVQTSSSSLQTESAAMDASIEGQSVVEPHPATFELTTDTGEVWTSLDGRHWKRK
jgi:hypothetical protein